jgi:hypothetical protein
MVRRPGSHGRTDGIAVYRLQRPAIDGSENRTFAMVERTASLRREFAPGGRAARVTHTLPWLAVTAVPPGVHFSIARCPSGRGSGKRCPYHVAGLWKQAKAWMPERSGHAVNGGPEGRRECPATW